MNERYERKELNCTVTPTKTASLPQKNKQKFRNEFTWLAIVSSCCSTILMEERSSLVETSARSSFRMAEHVVVEWKWNEGNMNLNRIQRQRLRKWKIIVNQAKIDPVFFSLAFLTVGEPFIHNHRSLPSFLFEFSIIFTWKWRFRKSSSSDETSFCIIFPFWFIIYGGCEDSS